MIIVLYNIETHRSTFSCGHTLPFYSNADYMTPVDLLTMAAFGDFGNAKVE